MLDVIQYIIINSMFHRIQIPYSVEHSLTLNEQAYIEAKTSHDLDLVYDACSPIKECIPGFLVSLVYNVINTSIESQTQSSCRHHTSIVQSTGSFLDATIGCNCSKG